MQTKKANPITKQSFCNIPTPSEALDTVTEFVSFAEAYSYKESLDEIIWWAISSDLADNNPLERGNHIHFTQQLKKVIDAVYVLYHGEVKED